ncbi:hypothetical protein ABEB36_003571 [Hypothenemus hampei]|uniref:Uncharacterized protein n=1 Tax=Hypothenemus hampei TaxID=57062 RepID=A0ABD1FAB3_HYPHA
MIATKECFIICVTALLLIHFAHTNNYGDYVDNALEDIVDFNVPEQDLDYDWSPPNGELPDDQYKVIGNDFESVNNEEIPEETLDSWIEDTQNQLKKRSFNFLTKKKSQVLCRVQRAIHYHNEIGHEFFPKSYTSYTCQPVTQPIDGSPLSPVPSHDSCYVSGNKCITTEKEQLFLKRRKNGNCWSHFIEAVGAGCKCLSRKFL